MRLQLHLVAAYLSGETSLNETERDQASSTYEFARSIVRFTLSYAGAGKDIQ